jgi:succinate dehydrogenase membrane anchor subunit
MDMRTPFAIVTGKGSAKEGTGHFWNQRLTALANVPLTIFLVWLVVRLAGAQRAELVQVLGNPLVSGFLVLSIFSFVWHMKLGMQVVIEDYVPGEGLKIFLIISNIFFCVGIALLSAAAVFKLAFGG